MAAMAFAQGGPPLITDDTGTVPPRKWEFNLAWATEHVDHEWSHEFPIFDFNRGVTNNLHVNFEVPWVSLSSDGERHGGIGNLGLGAKWRFLEAKGHLPALSIHPAMEFGLSRRSARLGLVKSGTSIILPLDIQWDFDGFALNGEVGMTGSPGESLGWIGGLAVGREVCGLELLAEIHGEGSWEARASNWIAQLGLRKAIGPSSTLLFAFGRSIAARNVERTAWTSYLALQLRF